MSHKPPLLIIAVIGSTGAGKSAFADMAVEKYGFTRVKFAGPLKDMLKAMGATEEDVNGSQEHRSKPVDLLCGKSWRYAMQTLGTEWRDLLGMKLWSNIFTKRIRDSYAVGLNRFVIDDMRFEHEVEEIKRWGGYVVAVRRPSVEPSKYDLKVYRLTRTLYRLWSRDRNVAPVQFGTFVAKLLRAAYIHPSEGEWFDIEPDFIIQNIASAKTLSYKCGVILKALTEHQSRQADAL